MATSLSSPIHTPTRQAPDYSIQVLRRGLQILDALLEARYPLNLEQLCARTGLVKSTAFRIVTNLLQGGYLTQSAEGYWLGLKLLQMGALVEEKFDLKQTAAPYLEHLCNQVNEIVHLAVLDNDLRVIYLDKLIPRQVFGVMMSRVGISAPMYCTGLGKVMAAYRPEEEILTWINSHPLRAYTNNTLTTSEKLLAELCAVRSRGYAGDNCEHEEYVRCVAAPIFNRIGKVVAAVSVSGPDNRIQLPLENSLVVPAVVATARKISAALGFMMDGHR